ncbi:MAG: hypothetical protein IPM42_08525 [Saprospiraceae bacterium]|nr:hypothetical protein [Saprospiraceae bacterium]
MFLKFNSTLLLLFFCIHLIGQSELTVGQWKSHLSFRDGLWVTQSDDQIIYASTLGLVMIDKTDLSVRFLSKEDGLSDVKVSKIFYDKYNDQLIIVYRDSNIDIVKGNDVINLPFIRENTTILGSKNINFVSIADENNAYIATDFGVVGLNLKKLEFTFTTFTDLKVNTISVLDNVLYAGTEELLYSVETVGKNLTDFGVWRSFPHNSGLPQSYEVSFLSVHNNRLFLGTGKDLYYLNANNFTKLLTTPDKFQLRFISGEGKSLIVGMENDAFIGKALFISQDLSITEGGADCINRVLFGIEDEKGRVWYADQWRGIRYTENYTSGCSKLEYDSPWANTAGQIHFVNKKAFFASGGVNEDFGYANSTAGFYIFEEGFWNNYNDNNLPVMRDKQFFNVQAITVNPITKDLFVGSYWNGIIKFSEEIDNAEHFNKDNSIMRGAVGDASRTRIANLSFDDKQNLWMTNYLSPRPLVVLTKDGQWYSFAIPGTNTTNNIAIDRSGNKWISLVTTGGGVAVFSDNNTIADPTDDKSRFINRNNSEITANKTNCVIADLDGSIWVGTSEGAVVFDCGDPFSDSSCRGRVPRVVVDGIPAPLLKDEDVLSIAIDGGNRKWFGTRNGIFVLSPDGMTEVTKFNVNNSPLLDNIIRNLAFNSATGEMFIISSVGIQSFRTETSGASRAHSSDVYAFPNPVRPDYTGAISIKGLVRDANVKITDINGKLVYETKALGGQATWDGRDYNGVRSSTGVYLVFSANENTSLGTDTYVTKILFVH